jgi:O-antigen/teichoic acid export membrane protein
MSSVIERTIKGGAGFFTANLVSKGFGFLFIVVASRFLGPAEFGVLSLGLSVTGVARKLAGFGLPNTIQRFLSGSGEKQSTEIYGAILLIGGIAATLSSVGLYIIAPWLSANFFDEPTLITPLRVLSAGVIVGVGSILLRAVLQAQEEVKRIVILDTIRSVAKVLLALIIFIWVQTATGAAWAVVGSFGLAVIIAWYYLREIDLHPTFEKVKPELRKVLGYSAPLVVVGFSYFLAQQADRLMLGWLSDAEGVGLYTVTSTLAMVMSTLHGALVSIFMPIASQAYRNDRKEEMRKAYLFVSKWVGAVNGVAFLALAGGGVWILEIFGPEYANTTTYHVLLVLSALYFIGTWVGPTGALLQMTDGHRVELFNTIMFVVVNIGLNYILIQYYGILGAAVATFGSGVLRNALQVGEIAYWHRFSPFVLKNVVILVFTITGVLGVLVVDHEVLKVSLVFVLIAFLGCYTFWAATDQERSVISGLMSRASVGR